MRRSILKLEECTDSGAANTFRAIIKTQHGRQIFIMLSISGTDCTIMDCFYADRNQGKTGAGRYSAKPLKLKTIHFSKDMLLSVIEAELDKKFYGIEYIKDGNAVLPLDEYLKAKDGEAGKKYCFLIMVGEGANYNGLPKCLRTRLKNKNHRSIYIELEYYKEGKGIVKQCHYYDRKYIRQDVKVIPQGLVSCFFPYSSDGIINLINHEICCGFTHMIVTDRIDIEANTMPICGAL